MKKETDIRRGRHCVFLMHVHLLFVTRYRRQIFDHDATEKLRTYFSNVCADFEADCVVMGRPPGYTQVLTLFPYTPLFRSRLLLFMVLVQLMVLFW